MSSRIATAHVFLSLSPLVVLLAGACSSSSPGPATDGSADAGPANAAATDATILDAGDFAQAELHRMTSDLSATRYSYLARCWPTLLAENFSSKAEALRVFAYEFSARLYYSNSARLAEQVAACVADWQKQSCDQATYAEPESCHLKGTAILGAACRSGGECQSGFCSHYDTTGCGFCTARARLFETCDVTSCAEGLYCRLSDQKCWPYAPEGGRCDDALCQGLLRCSRKTKLCTQGVAEGEDCSSATGDDCAFPLRCVNDKCEQPIYVGPGDECGTDPNGHKLVCRDSTCDSYAFNGTCRAGVRAGEPATSGQSCSFGYVVENGVCTRKTYPACGG